MQPVKVLFVGLGSIGTRHVKNLAALCAAQGRALEVTALRSSPRALPPEVAALVHSQCSELPAAEAYDMAFITNPTHLHAQVLQQLQGRVGTYFIEKPIFESSAYSLQQLGLGPEQKAYVAAPMRWCGVYLGLKQQLQQTPVFSVRAICSSYLPGWRPNIDYRENYSARRDMGGGVVLDLIHEWDYLVDLFGYPLQTAGMCGKYSDLEITSDDVAVYIARYEKFLCELHLDYFGREYRRSVEVFSAQGSLVTDFGKGTLTLPDGSVQQYDEPVGKRYEREMEYFVQYALHGSGESVNSPRKALQVLQLAEAENMCIVNS